MALWGALAKARSMLLFGQRAKAIGNIFTNVETSSDGLHWQRLAIGVAGAKNVKKEWDQLECAVCQGEHIFTCFRLADDNDGRIMEELMESPVQCW